MRAVDASAIENLRRCLDWYLPGPPARVLDLTGSEAGQACRDLLPAGAAFLAVDVASEGTAGPLPCPDAAADLVFADQCLAPGGKGRTLHSEIARVLAPEGVAFVLLPATDGRFPFDAGPAAAGTGGLRLVHAWLDRRGPRSLLVGVLQKGGHMTRRTEQPVPPPAAYLQQARHADPATEVTRGWRPYLEVMAELHALIAPSAYLEIGIRHGRSLRLAQCPAWAVDPQPEAGPLPDSVRLHRCTSDDFFFFLADGDLGETRFDLAFIDGMHLAEFAFRDFLNVEAVMRPDGVIVIDDVLPNHPVQAQRDRQSQVWTGDVWRLGALLQERRPDLRMTWLDTSPTGLLVISRLDPEDRRLWDGYNLILRDWAASADASPPAPILSRDCAQLPDRATLLRAIGK